jgi:amino acid transporter
MSVFGLVMINVIAVDSLRSLPATAQYGYSVIFYYLVAGLLFFIPTAFVAGELATAWPKNGGIYVWAKEAFGKDTAFSLVFLQWIYNVCWYPTILSLMAATLAYCINPELANNKLYMFITVSSMFSIIVIINCFGLKISNYLTTTASIFGIILPIGFVIILGGVWILSGRHPQIHFSNTSFFPSFKNINALAFFTSVLFSLIGIEMSAVHAQEVKNPQRDYPKAILISSVLILVSFILASIAIAIVVPSSKLNVVTGLLEAYQLFFASFHIQWLMPVIALLIICGGAGGVSAWILGPVKALLIASEDGVIPRSLAKTNRFNAPYRLIILQGIVFMLLSSVFIFMPSVNSSFWLLSDITSQLSLIFYIGLFCTAIMLRYKFPMVVRPFTIPFGKIGLWVTCLSGIIVCVVTIGFGFIPPSDISISWSLNYKYYLTIGMATSVILPYALTKTYARINFNGSLK